MLSDWRRPDLLGHGLSHLLSHWLGPRWGRSPLWLLSELLWWGLTLLLLRQWLLLWWWLLELLLWGRLLLELLGWWRPSRRLVGSEEVPHIVEEPALWLSLYTSQGRQENG